MHTRPSSIATNTGLTASSDPIAGLYNLRELRKAVKARNVFSQTEGWIEHCDGVFSEGEPDTDHSG